MNTKKICSWLLTLTGLLLLAGTVALSLYARNAPVKLLGKMPQAMTAAENWAQAVNDGNYAAVGSMMYGSPSLEPNRKSAYEAGDVLWEAFRESLSCEFTGECYPSESGIARDMTITALDLSAVMVPLKVELDALIAQRVAEAEDPDSVYDENGGYREEFVLAALRDAMETVLQGQSAATRREVTLELIYEDGSWWILPRQELIDILSGKLGKGA